MKFAIATRIVLSPFVFSVKLIGLPVRVLEDAVAVRVLPAELGEQLLRLLGIVVVAA